MANLKFMQPQEVEVLLVLPAIRRELAIEMKNLGLEQKKIAELLSVTEAAVSQYMKSKRAVKIKFSQKALSAIKKSAKKIKDKQMMLSETQALLKLMKQLGITCHSHKELADVSRKCITCFSSEEESCCENKN
ncbi:MAG: hypothetical protein KJ583_00475 [Nanoarchaeota archaeon]|nr:hypothetical protein [Nanoarchaeota archaeon]MBU1269299.1 hypothetical protein [Nanoarchaeota archaeon]MBU1603764.1 hypothetical protein [Nanoarchaeota archaeon]MBU2443889.1 hypothetical protein [Nanoarchaeota archaeon]